MDSPRLSALVKVPEVPDFNILGLTQLERTLIALGKAGAQHISIVAENVEKTRQLASRKVRDISLQFFPLDKTEDARQQAVQHGISGVFFVPQPLVVDLSILEDLKKQLDNGCHAGGWGSGPARGRGSDAVRAEIAGTGAFEKRA